MNKFILTLTVIFFFQTNAQFFEIFGGAGVDGGVPVLSSYAQNKQVLKPHFCKSLNANLYLQVRFAHRFGIEGQFFQNFQKYVWDDKRFYHSTGDKYEGLIKVRNNFYGYGINLTYRQPIVGSYAGIYSSIGYRNQITGSQEVVKTETFSLNSQVFEFKAKSLGTGGAAAFELGCQIQSDDERSMFSVGLQYVNGFKDLFKGSFKSLGDSVGNYTDEVTSKLNSFNLSLKYYYRLYYYDKSERIPEEKPTSDELKKHQEYVLPAYRKLDTLDQVKVKSKKITIDIYDPYREDGDRVSILLNGKTVLDNYTVTQKHYSFEVELWPGENNMVFHAENLGDIPPNTATVFVYDGSKKRKFDMKTNLNTSQILQLFYEQK
ncbi:MAG: hypothetical protein U0V72_00370 [Cytophagales bacterium]